MYVAEHYLGMTVEHRPVDKDELKDFAEIGLCGTAAVISPVGHLKWNDKIMEINDNKIGKISQMLYDTMTGIQWGKIPDEYGWIVELN